MAKRFTDTEKWERPWFRKLPNEYKLLWGYITDKCDIAGIWYVDFELASFLIGSSFDGNMALKLFEKQIRVLPCGVRWLVLWFADFQYGKLTPNNNMHRAVVRRLNAISAPHQPLISPSPGAKDKDKDMDKDKDKALKVRFPVDDLKAVVGCYLELTGKGKSDLAKDPGGWGRWMKEADALLHELGGRVDLSTECLEDRSKEWAAFPDWTLARVAVRAKDWLAKKQSEANR